MDEDVGRGYLLRRAHAELLAKPPRPLRGAVPDAHFRALLAQSPRCGPGTASRAENQGAAPTRREWQRLHERRRVCVIGTDGPVVLEDQQIGGADRLGPG